MKFLNSAQQYAHDNPIIVQDQIHKEDYYSLVSLTNTHQLWSCLSIQRSLDSMDGRPSWFASLCLKLPNQIIIPTNEWRPETVKASRKIFEEKTLNGVGNKGRERMFRLATIICYERALTDEETAALPGWYLSYRPTAFSGFALETYYSRGINRDYPTVQACRNPQKIYSDSLLTTYRYDECGKCRPCLARLAMEQYIDGLPWPMDEKEFYRRVESYNKRLVKVQEIILVEV